MSTIPSHANIIQRALLSENSTADFWTEHLTADLHKVLIDSGMKSVGVKPHPVNPEADPYFWTVFAIEDRALAQDGLQPVAWPLGMHSATCEESTFRRDTALFRLS